MNIYDDCSKFVGRVCAGRDESHGWLHMKRVADAALGIAAETGADAEPTAICAWLHDVADHKYDHDGALRRQVLEFLDSQQLSRRLMDIVDNVSWSYEKKMLNERVSYGDDHTLVQVEFSERELLVLQAVRDADRLEALDLSRCIEYGKAEHIRRHGREITPMELSLHVNNHAEEKLLKLASEYIVTTPGKRMAARRHVEFVNALAEFTRKCAE